MLEKYPTSLAADKLAILKDWFYIPSEFTFINTTHEV
jgi:hypothetical protein